MSARAVLNEILDLIDEGPQVIDEDGDATHRDADLALIRRFGAHDIIAGLDMALAEMRDRHGDRVAGMIGESNARQRLSW